MKSKLTGLEAELITLYEVVTNADLNEGRGGEVTLGWFLDRRTAIEAGKGKHVMGSDCPPPRPKSVWVVKFPDGKMNIIGSAVNTIVTPPHGDLRASGLAKLTDLEKRALGLK